MNLVYASSLGFLCGAGALVLGIVIGQRLKED